MRHSWWVLGLWALGVQAVWAATPWGSERLSGAELSRMPLPMVKAYVRERIAQQRLRGERAGADTTPPELTRLSVAPQSVAGEAMLVDIRASDKGSGIMRLGLYGGERGQEVSLAYDFPAPRWSLAETLSGEVSRYTPPGPVTLSWAFLEDKAGNFVEYEGEALTRLGPLQTTVINPLGGDRTPPELVRGVIETPRTRLSRTTPGSDDARYVRATLTVRDLGDPQVAGPAMSYLYFCTLDGQSCFGMRSDWPGPGVAQAALHFGGQPHADAVRPGVHYLREVALRDHAWLWRTYTSLRFPEGTDDLSAWFPEGDSILVKP
ncbi:hypothetical protein KAK06_10400 [Ideonella sp. 4Y11]|uniref:Uncharacterized protein n=1 Tax=Ideonella aquatica TaxID=2824119 RepID=A0A940YFT7_9BURK|nr:hypothetical protein [Ideonella aquatica]MBQ0959360.1 hypothetical protein [Ideonella aquatica]